MYVEVSALIACPLCFLYLTGDLPVKKNLSANQRCQLIRGFTVYLEYNTYSYLQ